jgi:hypothetical protein
MASNKNPQFLRNVFSLQSNGAAGEAGRRFGGQDKTALTRGSAATPQPEPHTKPARSQPLNNKPQRIKKHGSSKRKTVHLVLWVNPIVKAELQRIADQEGLSMSRAGGALLSRVLQQNIDMRYSDSSVKRVDGFSGHAHPPGSRYLPTAQSEPQNFHCRRLIPGN